MESMHSFRNELALWARQKIRFSRAGYSEKSQPNLAYEALLLARKYALEPLLPLLSQDTILKNLSTLLWLEEMGINRISESVLEVGCQDFSRLPALRAYFSPNHPQILGIELDAYPLLQDFHSRKDKADYFCSLATKSEYRCQDFFTFREPHSLVLSFYPFVSLHPALAWGLPSRYGDAGQWLQSFERNLKPKGFLFVVHQGKWEEDCFDEVRRGARLELVERKVLSTELYSLPHPPHGSLYRRL